MKKTGAAGGMTKRAAVVTLNSMKGGEGAINDRQNICFFLCRALQSTQEGTNIETITAGGQHVFITYSDGRIKPIRINGSGGADLIKEILSKL